MKHTLLILAAVVVGLIGTAGRAQTPGPGGEAAGTAVLRPGLKKGQTFSYMFTIETAVRQAAAGGGGDGAAGGAEAVEMQAAHTGSLRLNVLDVDDEGIATVSAVIPAIAIVLKEGAETIEGRGVRPPEDGGGNKEEEPKPEAEAQQNIAASVAQALARAVIRFEVMPGGKLRRVSGLDPVAEAAGADAARGALALGVFAPGSVARTMERLWLLDEPKADAEDPAQMEAWTARAAGDRWTIRDERALAYGDVATITRTHTLERTAEGAWQVGMSGKGELPGKRADPDPTVPRISLSAWEERGSCIWSPEHGRIERRDEQVVTEMTAALGDRSRTTRVQLKLVFEAAEPAEAAATGR